MQTVLVKNYKEWLIKAQEFLHAEIYPSKIIWKDITNSQQELLSQLCHSNSILIKCKRFMVPKEFFTFAEDVACHNDISKWSKLYLLLWRITHGEKHLLQIVSDALVAELFYFKKSVTRDAHKMKAFVRFRRYEKDENEIYIAWHQPDHNVVRKVAPFFKRRFEVMNWIIITPHETAVWDGKSLQYLPGIANYHHQVEDEFENLWKIYYKGIFNPARIKIKAMYREMPRRYWKNLPETNVISSILSEAPIRVADMLKHTEGISSSARDYFPNILTYQNLKQAASNCRACPIYQCAKQTVFGRGKIDAEIMIVGEQPGKNENEYGLPLIGPSGKYIENTLTQLGINIKNVYFTNAIKHFKHKLIEDKILYQTPTISEINACKPWLEEEINIINPKIIICLGLVAAKSLISGGFHLKERRGVVYYYNNIPIIATYHPSAILRCKDEKMKINLADRFINDIEKAIKIIS